MSRPPSGGRSLFFAEEIASKWFAESNTQYVHVVREATLSPALDDIEERRLRAIRVHTGQPLSPAKDNPNIAVDLSREAAIHLRDALTRALDATTKDVTR